MPVPEVVGKVCPGPGAADLGFIFVTRAWTVDINLKPPMLELKNEHVSFAHALQSRLFSPFSRSCLASELHRVFDVSLSAHTGKRMRRMRMEHARRKQRLGKIHASFLPTEATA